MKTSEDFLKSKLSVNNWNFLEHVLHSGEVYKQILSAMEQYGNQQYNKAIDDASEKAHTVEICEECGSRNIGSEDGYKFCRDCNTEINGVYEVDKLSILKLKMSALSAS